MYCTRNGGRDETIYISVSTSAGVFGPALIPGIVSPTAAQQLQSVLQRSFDAQLAQQNQTFTMLLEAQSRQIQSLNSTVQGLRS